MRALLFAAGRGERMRPLSDHTPKPLLRAGGRALIEWQIERLVGAGVREIVINTAHLAAQFEATLGDGARFGARIAYSREGDDATAALETLGGIVHALPLLGRDPFLAIASDNWSDLDVATLRVRAESIARGACDAHLVLVDNPPYHPSGDMGLRDGHVTRAAPLLTYAGIAVLAPRLFGDVPPGKRKLFPWLYAAADNGRVTGEHFTGRWFNVGTPQDLAALDALLQPRS